MLWNFRFIYPQVHKDIGLKNIEVLGTVKQVESGQEKSSIRLFKAQREITNHTRARRKCPL